MDASTNMLAVVKFMCLKGFCLAHMFQLAVKDAMGVSTVKNTWDAPQVAVLDQDLPVPGHPHLVQH